MSPQGSELLLDLCCIVDACLKESKIDQNTHDEINLLGWSESSRVPWTSYVSNALKNIIIRQVIISLQSHPSLRSVNFSRSNPMKATDQILTLNVPVYISAIGRWLCGAAFIGDLPVRNYDHVSSLVLLRWPVTVEVHVNERTLALTWCNCSNTRCNEHAVYINMLTPCCSQYNNDNRRGIKHNCDDSRGQICTNKLTTSSHDISDESDMDDLMTDIDNCTLYNMPQVMSQCGVVSEYRFNEGVEYVHGDDASGMEVENDYEYDEAVEVVDIDSNWI